MKDLKALLPFLTSVRFWKVVIAAVVVYLGSQGVLGGDLVILVTSILGVSVVIRTVDRFSENVKKK